jgi:phosphoribosylformylglycinamidine synthase subunit PurL
MIETEIKVTPQIAAEHGLTAEEYARVQKILGRDPNFTELGIFSVMWSEHCSYKSSRVHLKKLPTRGPHVVQGPGENAGVVDIGDGLVAVFKIESHNHPSFVEPFQGAATGVGGILRDIFTMGARPIASLNSLRFGSLKEGKTQHLLAGVVHGIGHYGNCFGVPTVGGEIYFEQCYHTNPLVNAMSVGILKNGETISATAKGVGNPVIFVGSATGKDGIGGASFASANITGESTKELPAVQVGDPFQEKKLLEACLEVIKTGAVVGMQDMGAAGIICSTSEMSAKGEAGMRIDLDKVPARQDNMKAWELLLSESQERMLMVVEKGREHEVVGIFEKWDLPAAVIGEVTGDGLLKFYKQGELEAEIPAYELVLGGGAPQYDRPYSEPAYLKKIKAFDPAQVPRPKNSQDLRAIAERLIALPNIASKRWVAVQYDSTVGAANASANEPSDAAVVLIKGSRKALVMTTDCNSRYVFADPYKGAMIAVAEAARNIVCSGGRPLGVTNCLNFGNPYDPEVYWQFVQVIKGMGEACRRFDTPVTGGNVSFYNQSPEGAVYPTPTIGMVGLLEDVKEKMTLDFKDEGDVIYLLGEIREDIGSSEYLHKVVGVEYSPAPYFDIEQELRLQQKVMELITRKLIVSAHDVSEGGLFVTLAESAFPRELGFAVVESGTVRQDAVWFGEAQGRVVVSVNPAMENEFLKAVKDLPHRELGAVRGETIRINREDWGGVQEWKERYDTAIGEIMASQFEAE